jgi:hypothetical protein
VSQPKLSKNAQKLTEAKKNITPTPPLVPMTDEQIEVAEAEKQQLVKKLLADAERPVARPVEAAPQQEYDDEMVAHSKLLAAQDEAARVDHRKANRAANAPAVKALVERLATAKTALSKMRGEHFLLANELAQLDVAALVRHYQFKLDPIVLNEHGVPTARPQTGANRAALLQRAAETVVSALKPAFTEADKAVALIESSAGARPDSQEFVTAWKHADRMVRRIEDNANSARVNIATMIKLQERLREDIKSATKLSPEPLVAKEYLPPQPKPRPKDDGTSFYDFDPRNFVAPPKPKSEREIDDIPEGPFKHEVKIAGIAGDA